MHIRDGVDLFLRDLVFQEKSDKTIKSYTMGLNHFISWLNAAWDEVTEVELITQALVRDYKSYLESRINSRSKRQLSPVSVNHYLLTLRMFLLFAQSKGIRFKSDPLAAIKFKPVAQQNQTKWLSDDEVAKVSHVIELLSYAGGRRKALYKAVFTILVNCGLRVAELTDLKLSDVLLDSGLLIIRKGKGDKYRHVPLGPKTKAIIKNWLEYHDGESPYLFYSQREPFMTTRAIQHMIGRLSRLSNIPFTVHQLRHTFAKRVANESKKIEVVASVLGHANIQTTRRYIQPSLQEIGRVVERVELE